MDVFQWDKNFETGLSDVDQQHHKLVDLTNQFGDLLSQDEIAPGHMDNLLQKLVDYTQYHFDEEERLMKSLSIDQRHLDLHRNEHHSFFQDVALLKQEMSETSGSTASNLFDFLINWLVYHILGCDKNMARQVKLIENGHSAAEAFIAGEQEVDSSTDALLRSLNNLFQQVTLRNHQLRDFNKTLEAKVEQRTRELREANLQLEQLATTDTLTGLANRRFAMQVLEHLWSAPGECDKPLSCMLIDADYFKEINDSYGHDAGDVVLITLASELKGSMRNDDIVCRLGGDEFLVICPNTSHEGLLHIAEQMHKRIKDLKVEVDGGFWQGSISVGLAVRTVKMTKPEQLLKAADIGVYLAKSAGKNCIKQGDL